MSRTATSPPRRRSSSSPTPPATSSTRATWSPARRPRTSRSSSWMPARASRADPPARVPRSLLASRTSCSASTRWTSSTGPRSVFDAIREEFTRLRRQARDRGHHVHPDLRAARRQRRHRIQQHALVRRPDAAPPPRARLHRSDRNLIDVRFPVQWVIRPKSTSTTTTAATPARSPAASQAGRRGHGAALRLHHDHSRIEAFAGTGRRGVPADVGDHPARRRPRRQPGRHALPAANPTVTQDLDADGVLDGASGRCAPGRRTRSSTPPAGPRPSSGSAYRLDVNTCTATRASGALALNEIGRVGCASTVPLLVDPYRRTAAPAASSWSTRRRMRRSVRAWRSPPSSGRPCSAPGEVAESSSSRAITFAALCAGVSLPSERQVTSAFARRLVRVVDAGELLDLAGQRPLVEALHVARDEHAGAAGRRRPRRTRRSRRAPPSRASRGTGRRRPPGRTTPLRAQEMRDEGDARDVDVPVLAREAEPLGEVGAHDVAVEELDPLAAGAPARAPERPPACVLPAPDRPVSHTTKPPRGRGASVMCGLRLEREDDGYRRSRPRWSPQS